MKIRIETNFSGEVYSKYFQKNIKGSVIEDGGFNQIQNNFINNNSELYKRKYDVVICHITLDFFQDMSCFVNPYSFEEKNLKIEIEKKLNFLFRNLKYFEKKNISVCFFNIPDETDSHYGYLETNSKNFSLNKIINAINTYLYNKASEIKNLYIFDLKQIVLDEGYKNIFDNRLKYLFETPLSLKGYDVVSKKLNDFIESVYLPKKKVICVDLDNTLWGGVIGENSFSDIKISNEGVGKIYKNLQIQLKNFKQRGLILTICSKNNYDDAKNFIKKNKNMILKWDDFVIKKINWSNKDKNIIEIANELNLGLDSFVFIDDNIHERTLVKNSLPEVTVPEFPDDISDIPNILNKINALKVFSVTKEDVKKTEQYQTELSRKKFEKRQSYSQFLKNLKIECKFEKLKSKNQQRFVQLINKTNQFNLTTTRYNESEINQLKKKGEIKMFSVSAQDKFGDLGIISTIILKVVKKKIYIDTLLMSCRAIGKEIEISIINFIIDFRNKKFPDHELVGIYFKTKKNQNLVSDFYSNNNFRLIKSKKDLHYFQCIDFKVRFPSHIKMVT